MKSIVFLGTSLKAIRSFPDDARRQSGFQLERVQHGVDPDDWKPMKTIGAGVREIRVNNRSGAYRTIYLATQRDAVYVLHAFEKKKRTTPKMHIDLARMRLKVLVEDRRS